MTPLRFVLALSACLVCPAFTGTSAEAPPAPGARAVSLFDGQTLQGWEGDAKLWRVEDGCLTGGSLVETIQRNEFLASTRDFTNFIIRFKIKLTGTNGFINSGFQIRSQRVPKNSEMAGYQCDFGEPSWYGAIYDESRRNKLMAPSDMKALRPVIKRDGWNDYVIRADGVRVTTWINGVMGVDYFEQETGIPNFDWGKLGIQVHSGGKAVVQVKNISIEELPPTPPGKSFRGAPEPKRGADNTGANRGAAQTAGNAEPVSPDEEQKRFTTAPGFQVELIASEDIAAGFGKFVAVDWDAHGNLWTMTALEYPVDGNENAAVAKELYASKAKDKVLVYDRDPKSPTGYASKPRVFAEGLAIPLGILPYKNGVYVQHGTEIVFLSDTDGDGKSDKREVILSGFGVQDSHLFPHQFTRAPGGWMWMAQGAFNYGKVRDKSGTEVQFDQTRMSKFRPDGSGFEITSQGPCNIWGLHMTMEGETWIQEANDFGYPAMPFHEYANYPGCSGAQWKSYAPEFPGTARDFAMGGTGLSGLAISDRWRGSESVNSESVISNQSPTKDAAKRKTDSPITDSLITSSWPQAYCDVIYIANPITRKIQAIKARRDGGRYALTKLPDFIQSSDEMFRPVALRLGPDGCLYIVDWYNKIISHNEVPRNHPERDKKRGRIWRVKHSEQKPLDVPDFTKLTGDELIAKLGGENTTQSHLAWQAIGDRGMKELAPNLKNLVGDKAQSAARRIAALWALESLDGGDRFGKGSEYFPLLKPLLGDANRNIRREAVRVLGARAMQVASQSKLWSELFDALEPLATDPDSEVRAELIKTVAALDSLLHFSSDNLTVDVAYQRAMPLLISMAKPPLAEPTMKSTQSGKTIKTGEAYEREFERYLVRMLIERYPVFVASFLDTPKAKALPLESRLVASLALEPKASAPRVAELLPSLTRPPNQEELLRLAQFPDEPGVGAALKKILRQPETSQGAVAALLNVRTKLDAAKVTPLLNDAAKQLLAQNNEVSLALGTELAGAFQLAATEPDLVRVLEQGWGGYPKLEADTFVLRPESLAALRALTALHSERVDLFEKLAEKGEPAVRDAALAALAASRHEQAPGALLKLWPALNAPQRATTVDRMASTKPGATVLLASLRSGSVTQDDVGLSSLEKMHTLLKGDPHMETYWSNFASQLQRVLRLKGGNNDFGGPPVTLNGPFTVEAWVKLAPGINNHDGILGAPDQLDMNFYGSQFRVWVAGGQHDILVARRKATPDTWTHYAVTRDGEGVFRLYLNGELDATGKAPNKAVFEKLRVGRTNPDTGGTDGWIAEYRIWNVARTAQAIRDNFDRSFAGELKPDGLVQLLAGKDWGKLSGKAVVEPTLDAPTLLTASQARAQTEKFAAFRKLADSQGSVAGGKELFTALCLNCHQQGGQGGQIAPALDGLGNTGVEAILRNVLTPNAAMEGGYRTYRVETKDGELLEGKLVSEDNTAIVLRQPNVPDQRIPRGNVLRARFRNTSLMPEGLLEALPPDQVSALFAYLKTLK